MNRNMTPEITSNVNKELEELNKETKDKLKKVSDKSYTGKWFAVKKVKVK